MTECFGTRCHYNGIVVVFVHGVVRSERTLERLVVNSAATLDTSSISSSRLCRVVVVLVGLSSLVWVVLANGSGDFGTSVLGAQPKEAGPEFAREIYR